MKRTRSSQETALSRSIVAALRGLGYRVVRVHCGMARAMHGNGIVKMAEPGTPDWVVVWPYIWLETKDLTGLSKEQREWHLWARAKGVPVAVVRSVGDAIKAVRGAGKAEARS